MKGKKMHQPYTSLKKALAQKGLTYKDVGEAIGIVETTVQLKINGASDFYLSEFRIICEKLGIDSGVFFEDFVAETITGMDDVRYRAISFLDRKKHVKYPGV